MGENPDATAGSCYKRLQQEEASNLRPDVVRIDGAGRPHIFLGHGEVGPIHDVILEGTRPVLQGFCQTCFDSHEGDHPGRKARNCPLMVAYLSMANRDRVIREELLAEIERLSS